MGAGLQRLWKTPGTCRVILELTAPRVPDKEPTVYHIAQVRKVLAACNLAVPTEDLVVRILVGSGLRRAEICGLAVLGPDGLWSLTPGWRQSTFARFVTDCVHQRSTSKNRVRFPPTGGMTAQEVEL
jgi:integrase